MIEAADQSANVETRETVLNLLAAQGIFSRRERSSLIDFIRRLHSIDRLDRVEELMALDFHLRAYLVQISLRVKWLYIHVTNM